VSKIGHRHRARPKPATEHSEQMALAYHVRTYVDRYPALAHFTALPFAEQSRAQAGKKWAEGVMPGYPDTLLDLSRGAWHGLRLELKREAYWNTHTEKPYARGEPTAHQVAWHERLTRAGFLVFVTWGWRPAWDILLWYISLAPYAYDGAFDAIVPDFPRSRLYTVTPLTPEPRPTPKESV
jgi:hypothetical protein